MKKRVWSIAILFCLLLGCCMTAQAAGWNSTFPPKTAVPADVPGEPLSGVYKCGQSAISLQEDGAFTFHFSHISSYFAAGHYRLQDGVLKLYTDDGALPYGFHQEGETLVFDAEQPYEGLWFSGLKNGNVFKKVPSAAK